MATAAAAAALLLLAAGAAAAGRQPQCSVRASRRVDCWPEQAGANQRGCESRGCCWNPSAVLEEAEPFCFFPLDYAAYQLDEVVDEAGGGQWLRFSKNSSGWWPNDSRRLVLQVSAHSAETARVTLSDRPDTRRWRVPLPLSPPTPPAGAAAEFRAELPRRRGDKFFVRLCRSSDGRRLFDTGATAGPLIFADQFLQLSVGVGADVAFGVGEHLGPFAKRLNQWQRLVLWNHDAAPFAGNNLYGSHNFLLGVASGGSAFGIFLLNSNAQEVVLQPKDGDSATLTYRSIGGILDFFVFVGPTPAQVLRQYRSLVGMPALPPLWALGFHLCRFGFKSSDDLRSVYERNVRINVPIDTMWADIDYMDEYKDWTLDEKRFGGLPEFVRQLRARGRHFVAIVDPGIRQQPGYSPYDLGRGAGVFMRTGDNKSDIVGKVWPGETVFPDFTHPAAAAWWQRSAAAFLQRVNLSGLWIDMNEPSSFYQGSKYGCAADNRLDHPPYVPHIVGYRLLYSQTLCPSALQHLGSHYDLHNMYGYHEAKATWQLLKARPGERSRRQFVLSRSTFPGIQRYAFHWTGDVYSDWKNLHYSVSSILNFNLYGVVFTGADVCGFNAAATEELCIRWTQLAAFYPFMRNHNSDDQPDQDPAAFSARAQAIMRSAIRLRYQLLPYLYSELFRASTNGTTVARSLMEEFPADEIAWVIDDQFLVGAGVMVCPVVTQGAVSRQVYFPAGDRWYDATSPNREEVRQKGLRTVAAPIDKLPLYFRGGGVVAQQSPGNDTWQQRRDSPFWLTAALDSRQQAQGLLFWDDGDSELGAGAFLLLQFAAAAGQLSSRRLHAGSVSSQMRLAGIELLGLAEAPKSVTVNGRDRRFSCSGGRLLVAGAQLRGVDLRQPLAMTWR